MCCGDVEKVSHNSNENVFHQCPVTLISKLCYIVNLCFSFLKSTFFAGINLQPETPREFNARLKLYPSPEPLGPVYILSPRDIMSSEAIRWGAPMNVSLGRRNK